jgi:VWFA-related protein
LVNVLRTSPPPPPNVSTVRTIVNTATHLLSATYQVGDGLLNSDANLSALALSSGALAPAFAPATPGYSDSVANSVSSITVTPTLDDPTASMLVNGMVVASGSASPAIALAVGSNLITIVVTAQDGATTNVYTISVTRAAALSITINQVNLDSCPVLRSYVSVSDLNGDPVTGLTSSDFTVNEDSITRTPVTVTVGGSSSISVAMTLDYSGSMSGEPRTNLQTAATTFINQLGTSDAMEIIKFSAAVEAVQTFTTDKLLLAAAVTNAWSGANGSTAFYDAVYKALTDTSARTGRKAVIAMTDGLDTVSTHTIDQVITYAASLGIPVYTIGLGSANTTVLSQLASSTNGHYYNAPTSADLQSIYSQIANVIQNQYEVTYASGLTDGAQHTLQISVNTGTATGSATRQFTSCSPTSSNFVLNVSITGTGSGSVHSSSTTTGVPSDISSTTGTCSVVYPSGNIVSLGATPDVTSTFDGWSGWSGACTTSPCSVIMNAARNVFATFTLAPMAKNATTSTPYASLAAALAAALPGAEIRVLDIHHDGSVSLDKAINLKGGWDAKYQAKSGVSSTLDGDFTILGGDSTVEAVDVKGTLSVKGGSLVVKEVKIQP